MSSNAGYMVFESCEDFEQGLRIEEGKWLPDGGVLDWVGKRQAATVFRTRKGARAAIERTHHYKLAFGTENMPTKKDCKIVPVRYDENEVPSE